MLLKFQHLVHFNLHAQQYSDVLLLNAVAIKEKKGIQHIQVWSKVVLRH